MEDSTVVLTPEQLLALEKKSQMRKKKRDLANQEKRKAKRTKQV